ncbi:MAG: tRNA pseudouridine(38-40) synthase TruA [Myxococcota bacterium]
MRWRLHLEYDGSGYEGWQLQGDKPTVQRDVEQALARFLGEPARVRAAGRTDTGVHAAMQIVCFDTEQPRRPSQVCNGLNSLLPPAIACLGADVVPDTFDPRHAPHVKTYRYTYLCRLGRSPLRAGRVWHVRGPLDVPAMDEAVRAVVGTHDLSTFRAVGCSAATTVRTVEGADVIAVGDEAHLRIHGTGFLRHTVRILAGSLHEVGRGRRPAGWIAEILAACDRELAGRTAPPEGLMLEAIRYRT